MLTAPGALDCSVGWPPRSAPTVSALASVVSSTASTGVFDIDRGFGSTWAKMASSWLIALMFLWTLIAPIVWPSRFGAT